MSDAVVRLLPQPFLHKPDAVLVIIDQNSIDHFKKQTHILWPWPRIYYAKIVEFLNLAGAKQVIFDMYFSDGDINRLEIDGEESDSAFAEACKGMPVYHSLILRQDENKDDDINIKSLGKHDYYKKAAISVKTYKGITLPVKPLMDTAYRIGNVNAVSDSDGVMRRVSLLSKYRDKNNDSAIIPYIGLITAVNGNTSQISVDGSYINTSNGQILINHEIHWYKTPFFAVPAADVIQSAIQIERGAAPLLDFSIFKGKNVFIGSNAPALFDLKSTPLNPVVAGVEVLATITENIKNNHSLKSTDKTTVLAIVFALALMLALLSQLSNKIRLHLLLFLVLLAGYFLTAIIFYTSKGMLLPVFTPVLALFITFVSVQSVYYFGEGKNRRQLKKMFDNYVDANVVEHLMENPDALKLGGERKELTVFFSDIAGFTSISEKMKPEELVEMLNEYLSEMAEIIMENKGYLDKYIGDAIMAVFGVPVKIDKAAEKACKAAVNNMRQLKKLKERWGEKAKNFDIRIGLSTGPMIAGNIGYHSRMDYTVIGDTVNLGSRLEGVNKQFGTSIIIDEATKILLSDDFEVRELDLVAVKGKNLPVKIFELMAFKKHEKLIENYNIALSLYKKRDWNGALAIFCKLADDYPEDGPSLVYSKRCEQYKNEPPPDSWDGVCRLTVK